MTKLKIIAFCYCLFYGINAVANNNNELLEQTNDTLIVAYSPTAPPFVMEENGRLDGLNIWLWNQIVKDLEQPYKLVEMDFHDVLDSLEKGSVDVFIDPLTITSERSKKIKFTHSFFASHSTIAVAKTSSIKKFKKFLSAFFNINFLRGLLVLLFIILSFGITIWLVERKRNSKHFRASSKGLWDGLWWTVVTMTTVGYGDKTPISRMGKIVALALMFSGLLFISGLTASVTSNLTVNELSHASDSFSEFKERKVGTVKNTSSEDFLRGHFFNNIKAYETIEEGLKDLKAHKLDAFIYDQPLMKYMVSHDENLEGIEILPIKFDVQFYAFALSKEQTHLAETISHNILEIMETQGWQVVLNEFGLEEL